MNAPASCRDRGKGGVDVGALCLSSCEGDPSALQNPTESYGNEDRHKAPALPHVRPLSLQNRGCIVAIAGLLGLPLRERHISEQWFRDYVQLQFRMDKSIRKFTESRFVDYYYGPPGWKAAVEHEAETPAPDLVRAATTLLDTLPEQGFEAHRALYLSKQVVALETVCRKLNGETFTLEDEVQRCFDIRPTWTPETRFEEAHALFDEVLPGQGSIFERLQALRNRYNLASEKAGLTIDFMRQAMNEARRRVLTFVNLPEGEEVELAVVSDKVFGGEN